METERVVFRVWNHGHGKGDVIALFPDIDAGSGLCQSYEHVGQHGGADYQVVLKRTRLATVAEYADLKHELEERGYVLHSVKRA